MLGFLQRDMGEEMLLRSFQSLHSPVLWVEQATVKVCGSENLEEDFLRLHLMM